MVSGSSPVWSGRLKRRMGNQEELEDRKRRRRLGGRVTNRA